MEAKCFRCGRTFSTDRTDAVFCDGACKAAFYREQGASGKHVPLDKFKSKMCENCGRTFWFNAYADREGKRAPTFCSADCRKKSWVRKQRAHFEAQREARSNSRSWDAFRERTQQTPPPSPPRQSSDFRDRLVIPRRWTETDALIWIFGSADISQIGVDIHTLEAVNKECRALNKKYHPDSNGGKMYPHLPTINAAWSYLKALYKK